MPPHEIAPTVTISLDLELSWGSFDHSFGAETIKMATWTHDVGVPHLLGLLAKNNISASWAIVGAMMHSSLPDVSKMPEVRYQHFPNPWFHYVPRAGDESTNPEWFGGTLVDLIRRAKPRQEIGFHSFSHVLFTLPGFSRARAVAEYAMCERTARELDLPTTCFVFPRNLVAYLDELKIAGFTCFRDVDENPLEFGGRTAASIANVVADFLGLAPHPVQPRFTNGLVSIPGSLMIRVASGWRKYISDRARLRRLRKGLERVREEGGVFHVWFHPENLYAEWPRLENVVGTFLDELGQMAKDGDVRIHTMGQLADEYRTARDWILEPTSSYV
jgi:hypothetical protein